MSSEKLTLGYWKIRGLAEPMRMMLNYAGIDFNDVMYECGDAPDFDRSCWFDVKFSFGLDFPNLPYLIDGETKLTQSLAIIHYLAVKTGLTQKDQKEAARCDMLELVANDLIGIGTRLFYSSPQDFASNKDAAVANAKVVIKQFSEALGNRSYFAGDNLSCTDFVVFETLDKWERFQPGILDIENISQFMRRIKELPTLQKYFSDPESTRNLPLNNKMANFK